MNRLKAMREKRNDLMVQAAAILDRAEEETRAMTKEETDTYEKLEEEIRALTNTMKRLEERQKQEVGEEGQQAEAEEETRSFEQYLRGESRALKVGDNGALLPRTVAQNIITAVEEICPFMDLATVYHVRGELVLPYYDETSGQKMEAAYIDELADLTEKSGDLKAITLKGYICGVLTKVSKKLINNADFDIVGFVETQTAKKIAAFLSKEALTGSAGKISGIFETAKQKVTAATGTLTADDLLDLQTTVKVQDPSRCTWVMNRTTFKEVRKLKDSEGRYLVTKDWQTGSGFQLLGSRVVIDENAPAFAASTKVIAYGDLTGYTINLGNGIEAQVLNEKYAEQYAVGVVAFAEMDGAITEQDKIAILEMGQEHLRQVWSQNRNSRKIVTENKG